jgi:hypothetical protein
MRLARKELIVVTRTARRSVARERTPTHGAPTCRTALVVILLGLGSIGCGTTRWTDTLRTATEQLVVSHAVDQAVSDLDFKLLEGQKVFFDPQYIDPSPDRGYIVSSIRQQLLLSGCLLMEERPKADVIVEARCGAAGTDRHDQLLLGLPQMSLPPVPTGQAVLPAALPEVPLIKKTNQVSAAKIAVFAYNRATGEPVLQSGIVQYGSNAKNFWVLGAGPIQGGRSRKRTGFGGDHLNFLPGSDLQKSLYPDESLAVAQRHVWELKPTPSIQPAGHATGGEPSPPKTAAPAAAPPPGAASPPASTAPPKGSAPTRGAVILPPTAAETTKPNP